MLLASTGGSIHSESLNGPSVQSAIVMIVARLQRPLKMQRMGGDIFRALTKMMPLRYLSSINLFSTVFSYRVKLCSTIFFLWQIEQGVFLFSGSTMMYLTMLVNRSPRRKHQTSICAGEMKCYGDATVDVASQRKMISSWEK